MKKVFILTLFFVLASPFMALAHTTLTESNPAEGEVLAEHPEKIELTFGTVIEEGSTMELQGENSSHSLDDITVSGNVLSGTINEELESGQYIIGWKIIGEDGHPIEGEIPFGLAVETASEEPAAEEPAIEETQPAEEPLPQDEAAEVVEGDNIWVTILIVVIAIFILFGIIKLVKKKG